MLNKLERLEVAEQQQPLSPVTRKRRMRSVSFGEVCVREFKQVLEVHPSCSSGPGIGLGWKYSVKQNVHVETWESGKKKEKSRRSEVHDLLKKLSFDMNTAKNSPNLELKLTKAERVGIAKKNGFSDKSIQSNVRKIQRARLRRVKSLREDVNEEAVAATITTQKEELSVNPQEKTKNPILPSAWFLALVDVSNKFQRLKKSERSLSNNNRRNGSTISSDSLQILPQGQAVQ